MGAQAVKTGTDDIVLEVRGLTKVFGSDAAAVRAVDGIDLTVRRGELVIIMGPSGSGKTTLLTLIGGLLKPTSGTARVAGHDILADPTAVRSNVGFLSTSTALYGRLTAQEMVEYFGRLHGISGKQLRLRVEELFELLSR